MTDVFETTEMRLRVAPDHAAAADARRTLGNELANLGVAKPLRDDVVLVMSELVTNAVDQRPGDDIRVDVDVDEHGRISVSVANLRTGRSLGERDQWLRPDRLGRRGRGLQIVQHLVDDLQVTEVDGWTAVSCRWQAVS